MSEESPLAVDAELASARRAIAAAFGAIFIVWLLPRRAARLTLNTPLWSVWLAHLLAGGVVAVLVIFFEAANVREWGGVSREGLDALVRIGEAQAIALGVFTLIEAGFLFLSMVLLPWAAHDEPLLRTWRHTLRSVWLATGCAIPVVCFLQAVFLLDMPSHVREMAILLSLEVLSIWVLSVALRVVGVRRECSLVERPPVCEVCGYNLSYTPVDSRCPECGTAVCESFCPGRRTPTVWEARKGNRTLAEYVSCSFDAIFRPGRFFRLMEARRGLTEAKVFLLIQAVLTGILAFGTCYWVGLWLGGTIRNIKSEVVFISTIIALYAGIMTLGWTHLLAAVTGLLCRRAWKENAMPAVAKVFYYTSAFAPVVVGFCGLVLGPVAFLMEMAGAWRWYVGYYQGSLLIGLGWFVLLVIGLLLHLRGSIVGVRQVRYANV